MASFFERLGAYLIDIVIVSLLLSLISYNIGYGSDSSYDEEITKLEEEFTNNEISTKEYMMEYGKIIYNQQNDSKILLIFNIVLYIAYFVVFQYLYDGRTIGKKILKIKIVDKNNSKPKLWKLLIRPIFIMNLCSGIVSLILLYTAGSKVFTYVYFSASYLEMFFMLISVIFILYRKDKRGLHDIMAGTMVIKEV